MYCIDVHTVGTCMYISHLNKRFYGVSTPFNIHVKPSVLFLLYKSYPRTLRNPLPTLDLPIIFSFYVRVHSITVTLQVSYEPIPEHPPSVSFPCPPLSLTSSKFPTTSLSSDPILILPGSYISINLRVEDTNYQLHLICRLCRFDS